jgi:release factor glutamine methyltransferase
MESEFILSDIQNSFRSELSGHYPDDEIRNIYFLAAESVLNYSKIDILLRSRDPISAEAAERFQQILKRLMAWEPIQYILGYTEFYGLPMQVDARVLIPRPETEEMVQWIIRSESNAHNILDIGTGSGCIAIALAVNLPEANVSACDISSGALYLAGNNAQENKAHVQFFETDILNAGCLLPRTYEVIVSNPPYVQEKEKLLMRLNVLGHEPDIALFVPDDDPLKFYRCIARLGSRYMNDNGAIYLEINEYFSGEVMELLKDTGFQDVEVKSDLNGKARMVRGRK